MQFNLNQLFTPEELCAQLGENIKKIRIGKNITISGLAQQAGISENAVMNLEAGKSNMSTFMKVLTTMGIENRLFEALEVQPETTIAEIKAQEINATRQRARPKK